MQPSDCQLVDDGGKGVLGSRRRRRARSINPISEDRYPFEDIIQSLSEKKRRKPQLIPTVFKYYMKKGGMRAPVYISGSMTEWQSREMASFHDESTFLAIIDCWPGNFFFKFFVNGRWCHDESQPVLISKDNVVANVLTVKAEDSEVFEALACDSFAAKTRHLPRLGYQSWSQVIPLGEEVEHPPFLPPHLSHNLLNDQGVSSSEPVMLPQPPSHVIIQHLYAQSIKDKLLILASTTRYRKKCVTVLFYTPID